MPTPRAFAYARQGPHQRIPGKIQAIKRSLYTIVQIPRVSRIEFDLDIMHPLHQRIVIVAAELSGQCLIFRQQCRQIAQAGRDRIEYRHVGRKMRLLFDIRDLETLLHD